MDYRLNIVDLKSPEDIQRLKTAISEAFDQLDTLVTTTTAPNGNISGREGQVCLYKNGSTWEVWFCLGLTVWQQIDASISIPLTYLDTDITLAANSDVKVASQKATKAYVDTKVPVPLTTVLGGTGATAAANAASGVCVLDAGAKVATANLGSGSATSSTFLRGDQSWATPVGVQGADAVNILNVTKNTTSQDTWFDVTGASVSVTLIDTGNILATFTGIGKINQVNTFLYRIVYDSTAIATLNLGNVTENIEYFLALGDNATSVPAGTYTVKLQVSTHASSSTTTTTGLLSVIAW